jgi:predicted nucleic acid-binding protein
MSAWVVDASVAVKWYVPEAHSGKASRLLAPEHDLHVPELFIPEFGNVLWKKVARREIAMAEARRIAKALHTVPLEPHRSGPLLEPALEIALATGRTVYDATYLALAVALGCRFVTADERMQRALEATPLFRHVAHVGEL